MEAAKYPEDQRVCKCFPKYGNKYLFFKYEDVFALSAPITHPRVSCGDNSSKKCICSASPLTSETCTSISLDMFSSVINKSWRIL